jgi:hypothetical protein
MLDILCNYICLRKQGWTFLLWLPSLVVMYNVHDIFYVRYIPHHVTDHVMFQFRRLCFTKSCYLHSTAEKIHLQ